MSKTKTPRKAKVNKRAGSYKPGSLRYIWYKIRTTPTAMIGTCFIIGLFLFSFVSPFVLSNDPLAIDILNQNARPSWEHIFGCDEIGRDIFARIIYGARGWWHPGRRRTGSAPPHRSCCPDTAARCRFPWRTPGPRRAAPAGFPWGQPVPGPPIGQLRAISSP